MLISNIFSIFFQLNIYTKNNIQYYERGCMTNTGDSCSRYNKQTINGVVVAYYKPCSYDGCNSVPDYLSSTTKAIVTTTKSPYLQCYQCNSVYDLNCFDYFSTSSNQKYLVSCPIGTCCYVI